MLEAGSSQARHRDDIYTTSLTSVNVHVHDSVHICRLNQHKLLAAYLQPLLLKGQALLAKRFGQQLTNLILPEKMLFIVIYGTLAWNEQSNIWFCCTHLRVGSNICSSFIALAAPGLTVKARWGPLKALAAEASVPDATNFCSKAFRESISLSY